jgi:hypothetical protein
VFQGLQEKISGPPKMAIQKTNEVEGSAESEPPLSENI